jgi:hypothetical protein
MTIERVLTCLLALALTALHVWASASIVAALTAI